MKSYGDTDGGDGGPTLWIYLISLNCVVNSGEGDKFVLCVFCHHKKLEKINYKNKMLSYIMDVRKYLVLNLKWKCKLV